MINYKDPEFRIILTGNQDVITTSTTGILPKGEDDWDTEPIVGA